MIADRAGLSVLRLPGTGGGGTRPGADPLPDAHAPMTETVPVIAGLSAIADRYDAFVIDLWGVVHDGTVLHDGIEDVLAALQAAGKPVCLLTNAQRRVETVRRKLDDMGLDRALYPHLYSSGELTFERLRDRPTAAYAALGERCYYIGSDRDRCVHEGLPLTLTDDARSASFALLAGPMGFFDGLEAIRPMLDAALDAGLPAVCANPDRIVWIGDRLATCAGTFAAYMAERGASVLWHGKPHRDVYDRCLALLGVADPARVLGIGDALATDIAGALGIGADGLLVGSGIHAADLGAASDRTFRTGLAGDRVTALAERAGIRPTWAIDALRW